MAQIPTKPVQLPNCQRVAFAQRFETSGEAWAIFPFSRSLIFV
jgi:hypothetical protein